MKTRTVGLRITLFGLLALMLGTTMAMEGGTGGFALSEVLAAERVGVPIVSKLVRPPARVSPFFDSPVLNAMLMKARLSASAARVEAFREKPVLDATLLKTRLASSRAVSDTTIPWGYYYPIEYAQTSYYAGLNQWYLDTYYLWDVIEINLEERWPKYPGVPAGYDTWVEWSWAIQDEYENNIESCYGYDEYCATYGWFPYPIGSYECVGNERFITGVWAHYWHDEQWNTKLLAWYDDYNLGECDPN
jgi:hypothetical protein